MLKQRAFRTALVILALALAGAVIALKIRSTAPAPTATPAIAAPVLEFLPDDLITVTPHELRQTITVSGALRAVNQAVVKAKVAGEIREVLVREGAAVTAGQVLIRMDESEYQARVAQANGALQAARGQLEIAGNARDNNRALLGKGFISQNAFDNSASQYAIARANLDSAKGALDVAQKSLADTVLRSPITGQISIRSVQQGEKVSADNRLLEIVDLRRMEMEASVPATDITQIRLGQPVSIRVDGMPQAVAGSVTRINPGTQSGSRSILTYIQLDNPDGALRGGMFGEAELTLSQKKGILSVPQAAIRQVSGRTIVYVIENGVLAEKSVTLGLEGNDDNGAAVEVTTGLASGAQVVKANLGNLQAGTPARLVTNAASAAARKE
ncbi:efflux RND transporter periplasmic adaptor subunit [Herminiimonas sp. CN]|uniref:efflux RND transporter periplasmic adaptor subunit n=1 Tax=Herminiimonas sp. CN TaxID=1349818 RepID=UPI000684EAFD|nr:efflux RND transporter periplasmic adaptor subunit [Herminiimonas sp. CN]